MEQRFELGNLEAPSDAPGLVLSGDVPYVVAPDGTRTAVGGGGAAFPPEWTVGADGSLSIAATVDASLLEITRGDNSFVVDIDTGEVVTYVVAENVAGLDFREFLGPAQVRLNTNQGLSISSRAGLGPTDPLLQVDSEYWGDTVLFVMAGSIEIGAPMKFLPAGPPILLNNSAPADGVLAANEAALWFDSTNGAAKLMVKAKQANGTVVTGELALT